MPKKNAENRVQKLARKIREAILADITDRRGWRQEWEQFDDDVKSEIRQSFDDIIIYCLLYEFKKIISDAEKN